MTDTLNQGACCAHITVKYAPRHVNGMSSSFWGCQECGKEFTPMQGCTDDGSHEPTSEGEKPSPCDQTRALNLLPCPFCGSAGDIHEDDGKFYAFCYGPDCFTCVGEMYDRDAMPDHEYYEREEAAKAWNRRANG